MSERVVVSMGSNLGDRLAHLQRGLDLLVAGGVEVEAVSSVYETAPVGGPEQGAFLNVVAVGLTALRPHELLLLAHDAESAEGRVRHERWGPRSLDVDLVVYGDVTSGDPTLTLPHPRAHERAFVLVPWAEVEPDAQLPAHGGVAALAAGAAGDQQVVPRVDLALDVAGTR